MVVGIFFKLNINMNIKTAFLLIQKNENKDNQPLFFFTQRRKNKQKKIRRLVKNGTGEMATLVHF